MALMIWQHSNFFAWIKSMTSDTWCCKMLPMIMVFHCFCKIWYFVGTDRVAITQWEP